MNIFALPGINQKTERWAANLLNELAAPGRTLTVQHYLHWDCEDTQCLNLHGEVDRLQGCEIDLLVAKSLGVMIGLQACSTGVISPSAPCSSARRSPRCARKTLTSNSW